MVKEKLEFEKAKDLLKWQIIRKTFCSGIASVTQMFR